MRYPDGDETGRKLFFDLAKRAEQDRYDDDFLLLLIEYRNMYPDSEHFDLFYGRYAAFHGNHGLALEHAQKAYRKRTVNFEVWKLLAKCYVALGQPEKAMPFQAYCCKFYTKHLDITMPLEQIQRHLGELSIAMGRGNYAPFCESKMSLHERVLQDRPDVFGGEPLPVPEDVEGYAYWVGAYNEMGKKSGYGTLLKREMAHDGGFELSSVNFAFDIMRSRVLQEFVPDLQEGPVLVPVAAWERNQQARFRNEALMDGIALGQWEYSFFRIDEKTQISSSTEQPLVFGKPIPLGHRARRKRVVLNVLLDALTWNAVRRQGFQSMPNTMEFFSRGIIFDQHFSVAEYTYPSLPTIETGMYPHHSQVFNERAAIYLDERYITLSERMKELGYYCVNIMGSGDAVYNGATRGYDRLLVTAYDLPSYVGIERAIRQMEVFSECDQFIFLHIMETHPWSIDKFTVNMEAQAKLSLKDYLNRERKNVASVYLPNTPIYQVSNSRAIRHTDRSLKMLFDYILAHYDEEEYIVQVYSDHGTPIYDENPGILSDGQTGAAWMLRGSGVPSLGMVEELTSAVDIYPTLAKLAGFPVGDWVDGNLPSVFGGKEREYVFSNSLFPGQTYKLCIRAKEYECYLESLEPVDEDGTVDLSGAEMVVRMRNGDRQAMEDPSLNRYFLRLAEEYTSSFNHGGRHWKSMREARPEWFHEKEISMC